MSTFHAVVYQVTGQVKVHQYFVFNQASAAVVGQPGCILKGNLINIFAWREALPAGDEGCPL